jgi:hypothetical protein
MLHNALALTPGDEVVRTECLARGSKGIRVKKVEVLRLTRLGYHYVSRLDPAQMMYSERTSAGHEYKGLPPCKLLPWNVIQTGLRQGEIEWHDVIDFYARHNCDEYAYFRGYRWSKKGPERLPVPPPARR